MSVAMFIQMDDADYPLMSSIVHMLLGSWVLLETVHWHHDLERIFSCPQLLLSFTLLPDYHRVKFSSAMSLGINQP